MKKYDYVMVGSGLFAGVYAYEARKKESQYWLWRRETT